MATEFNKTFSGQQPHQVVDMAAMFRKSYWTPCIALHFIFTKNSFVMLHSAYESVLLWTVTDIYVNEPVVDNAWQYAAVNIMGNM